MFGRKYLKWIFLQDETYKLQAGGPEGIQEEQLVKTIVSSSLARKGNALFSSSVTGLKAIPHACSKNIYNMKISQEAELESQLSAV